MSDLAYFNQETLWGQQAEPYQIQVLADILSLLPADVETVLDVGCGDGIIANALPERLKVVAVDTSTAALRHVRRKTCVASIGQLPFADASFDLVMSNDVLEHLDDACFSEALAELGRVARRYVLITVPNGEQLLANFTRCADCGLGYHVNHHRRSIDDRRLLAMELKDFQPIEIRFSGDETRPPCDPTMPMQHALDYYRPWERAICLRCKSHQQLPAANDLVHRSIESVRASRWARLVRESRLWNQRTEVIGLYARDPRPHTPPARPEPAGHVSALCADFSNLHQQAIPDITPGSAWARYYLPQGIVRVDGGITAASDGPGPVSVPIWFPAVAQPGDWLTIETSGQGEFQVISIDGVTGQREGLQIAKADAQRSSREVAVTRSWSPGRFGLAVEVLVPPGLTVHSIEYHSFDGGQYSREMIRLESGHNVIPLGVREGVPHTWGFFTSYAGRYPRPAFPTAEEPSPAVGCHEIVPVFRDGYAAIERRQGEPLPPPLADVPGADQPCLTCQRERLASVRLDDGAQIESEPSDGPCTVPACAVQRSDPSGADGLEAEFWRALEHEKLERAKLQQMYENSRAECDALQKRLALKTGFVGAAKEIARTLQRKLLGPVHRTPQYYPNPWRPWTPRTASGGMDKVLILSHLYPHPEQPGLGSFVLEQVKALRETAGIDARVMVGRPFDMNARTAPLGLWSRNRQYMRFIKESSWWELDGVPVFYLPYRVMLGLWNRSRMYRRAMLARIDQVRAEFPFQCVHAHTAFLDGTAGRAIAERFQVPLIVTEHTNPFSALTADKRVRAETTASLRAADRVIAVSEAQRRDVSPYLNDEHQDRLVVLPNGVDASLFYPSRLRRPNPEAPRVLYVGYFADYKNVPLLLRAFAEVVQKVPRARLRLAGSGVSPALEGELKHLAGELGIAAQVEFLGYQSRESIARIMREESDILALSSRTESFGCVLTEAMACGLPVVSTRSGGPDDIVTEPFLGRLCENDSTSAFAEALLDVVQRLESFERRRIRRHAEAHYSYSMVAASLNDMYREVIAGVLPRRKAA